MATQNNPNSDVETSQGNKFPGSGGQKNNNLEDATKVSRDNKAQLNEKGIPEDVNQADSGPENTASSESKGNAGKDPANKAGMREGTGSKLPQAEKSGQNRNETGQNEPEQQENQKNESETRDEQERERENEKEDQDKGNEDEEKKKKEEEKEAEEEPAEEEPVNEAEGAGEDASSAKSADNIGETGKAEGLEDATGSDLAAGSDVAEGADLAGGSDLAAGSDVAVGADLASGTLGAESGAAGGAGSGEAAMGAGAGAGAGTAAGAAAGTAGGEAATVATTAGGAAAAGGATAAGGWIVLIIILAIVIIIAIIFFIIVIVGMIKRAHTDTTNAQGKAIITQVETLSTTGKISFTNADDLNQIKTGNISQKAAQTLIYLSSKHTNMQVKYLDLSTSKSAGNLDTTKFEIASADSIKCTDTANGNTKALDIPIWLDSSHNWQNDVKSATDKIICAENYYPVIESKTNTLGEFPITNLASTAPQLALQKNTEIVSELLDGKNTQYVSPDQNVQVDAKAVQSLNAGSTTDSQSIAGEIQQGLDQAGVKEKDVSELIDLTLLPRQIELDQTFGPEIIKNVQAKINDAYKNINGQVTASKTASEGVVVQTT